MILTYLLPKKRMLFLIVFFLLSPSAYSNNSVTATVTYCFTPGGMCTEEIIDIIHHAQKKLWIQAYQFTSQPISKAVIEAKQRGVEVDIILDKTQCPQHPKDDAPIIVLSQAGIPVWIDNKPKIAHNKIIIVDNQKVISGSFNFSDAAQKSNAENVLIMNSPELANAYAINWKNRQAASQTLKDYITLKNISHKHAGKKSHKHTDRKNSKKQKKQLHC